MTAFVFGISGNAGVASELRVGEQWGATRSEKLGYEPDSSSWRALMRLKRLSQPSMQI